MSKALLVQVSKPKETENGIEVLVKSNLHEFYITECKDGSLTETPAKTTWASQKQKWTNFAIAIKRSNSTIKKEMLKSASEAIEEYKAKSKPKTYRVNIAVSFGVLIVEVTTESADDEKIFEKACKVAANEILSTAKLGGIEDL